MIKGRHLSTVLVSAVLLAACSKTSVPGATTAAPAVSSSEQAFLDASGATPRYKVMIAETTGDTGATAEATATSTATTTTTTTTTTSSGSLETDAMMSHANAAKLNATVSVSSSRPGSWFAMSNIMDGNLHSAWGPAADDANPTLTFDLGAATSVKAMGIKQSGDAHFDVAVKNGNGDWTVVGTDMTSTATMLDWVDLTASTATQVQLRFHGDNVGKLLVCEVQWFGDNGGGGGSSPTPMPSSSASASPEPSATPTASPSASATPTPMPSESASTEPTPTPMPSESASTEPTPTPVPSQSTEATPTPSPSADDQGCDVNGEWTFVWNRHHYKVGCHVRKGNHHDDGSCEIVDVDTHVKFQGTCDQVQGDQNNVSCRVHLSNGNNCNFNMHRDGGNWKCNFQGNGMNIHDVVCNDMPGHGVVINLNAHLLGDALDFWTRAHAELES